MGASSLGNLAEDRYFLPFRRGGDRGTAQRVVVLFFSGYDQDMPIRVTTTIKALAIIYFAVFLIVQTSDQFFGTDLTGILALVPARVVGHLWFWQLFTYSFLHADVLHLFLNLLMLVFVGSDLSSIWGRWAFIRYYVFCCFASGLLYLCLQVFLAGGLEIPMVGASGGIYGLLIAFGLVFSERQMAFMMMFPMRAKHFIWVLAVIEFMVMIYSPGSSRFSAVAHLGGMMAGFLYLWGLAVLRVRARNIKARIDSGKTKQKGHLKLVVNRDDRKSYDDDDEAGGGPKTWH